MAGKKLSLLDAIFLAGESRESMMHVGGMLVFTPPAEAGPAFLRRIHDELRGGLPVHPPWNLRLRTPYFLRNPLQAWVEDDDVDLDYHVRRSALPAPGDERELGILVSRLHGIQLDFHRPPWEVHFIEGLAGGRFAMYFKLHHALVDGYTAMRMLAASLSTDPGEHDTPLFFAVRPPPRSRPAPGDDHTPSLGQLLRVQAGAAREAGRAVMNVLRAARAGDRELVSPLAAPRTLLNRRISRNRRFATQQLATERVRTVAHAAGGTINDVLLSLCGASLRRLLIDLDALPAEPLTAMVPVNIRPKDDPGGGNQVAAILTTLATDVAEPRARLDAVIASTRRAKAQLAGLSRDAMLQYSAMLMTPLTLGQVTGTAGHVRPAFNVAVSNVPGPSRPLYFRGARLDATYPLSIPFHGYGLNITVNGYCDTLNFGFIGCRDAVPRLQRLAVYAAEALDELERSVPAPDAGDVGDAPDAPDAPDAGGAADAASGVSDGA